MIMTHQKNILNYQVDMIFELRNSLNLDIPAIGVEINEDGHSSYDKKNEEERKKIIEYFDNIMFEINIKRGSSVKQIKEEVKKVSEIIKIKADDMLIMNNPNICVKELEKRLLAENYGANLVAQFLANHNTGDKVFCLRHDVVGDYLGIGSSNNYRKIRQLIAGTPSNPSRYIKNVDYKIVKLKDIHGSAAVTADPSMKDSLGRVNDGSKASQTQIVLFNRPTYFTVCVQLSKKSRKAEQIALSFAKMYDIIIMYLEALRVDALKYNKNTKMGTPSNPSRYIKNVDYKIVKLKDISSPAVNAAELDIHGSAVTAAEPSMKDSLGRINDGGKAAKTQIILFNRPTYFTVCVQLSKRSRKAEQIALSFAKMYDIIIMYFL